MSRVRGFSELELDETKERAKKKAKADKEQWERLSEHHPALQNEKKRKEIEREDEEIRKKLLQDRPAFQGGKSPKFSSPPAPKRKGPKWMRGGLNGITNASVRRLARRGGVKRISGVCYAETRQVLKDFLHEIIPRAIAYTDHARRKTVTPMDIVRALKTANTKITLYGFGV